MSISTLKVHDTDYPNKDVASLPVKPQMSAADLQASFDKLVKLVVAPKLNALIDALAASTGANEIGESISGMEGTTVGALLEELYTKKANADGAALSGVPTAPTPAKTTSNAQIATTAFVQAVVADAVFQSGSADMAKATYDPQTKAQDIFAYADNAADNAAKMQELTVSLPTNGWTKQTDNTYRQTVTVTGLAASGASYIVSPSPASFGAYGENGVYMLDVSTANQATFAAKTLPTAAMTVNILKIGVKTT